MAKPMIGISAPRTMEKTPFGQRESMLQVMEYANAIAEAGGRPVLLPPTNKLSSDLLDGISGLVLSGGGDISPELYGEEPSKDSYGINKYRDAHEVQLIKEAQEKKIPILAICRGLQLINVLRGGTLLSHIDEHWQETDAVNAHHQISIKDGSELHRILNTNEISVNSYHHQGIDQLGEGLVPVAYAGNVIEAIEDPENSIIGVQWHPEHLAATSELHAALFENLIEKSK